MLALIGCAAIPGGSSDGTITVAGSSSDTSTVDEPFTGFLPGAGGVAPMPERRRVAQRRPP